MNPTRRMVQVTVLIEDTYAEAFRSLYGRVLVTAKTANGWRKLSRSDRAREQHDPLRLRSGHRRLCRWGFSGANHTDGRPGAYLQFHVPRFRKDRVEHLERVMLARISQNILTCPTARCFNGLDTDPYFKTRSQDRVLWRWSPVPRSSLRPTWLGHSNPRRRIFLSRRFGYADGLMGGNVWFMGGTEDAAIEAAERRRPLPMHPRA